MKCIAKVDTYNNCKALTSDKYIDCAGVKPKSLKFNKSIVLTVIWCGQMALTPSSICQVQDVFLA